MTGLYLPILKRMASGTAIVVDAVTKRCLDVFVRNDSTHPLYVSGVSGLTVLETRFHDISSTNINGVAGAFVEIGTPAPADVANTILKMRVTCTFGTPVAIRKGVDATAAAAGAGLHYLRPFRHPDRRDHLLDARRCVWRRRW